MDIVEIFVLGFLGVLAFWVVVHAVIDVFTAWEELKNG
jgi:hypothetical protein